MFCFIDVQKGLSRNIEKKEKIMLVKQQLNNTVGRTCYKLLKSNFDNKTAFKATLNIMNVGREFVGE